MLVSMLGETMELSNDIHSLELLFDQLEKLISKDKYYLDHILLNGAEIYNDIYQRVQEEIEQIKTLHIHLITPIEREKELVCTLHEYLAGAMPSMTLLVDQLYQGIGEKVGVSISQFSEGAQWILSALQYFLGSERYTFHKTYFQNVVDGLQPQFVELYNLLIQKEFIHLADFIRYELLPILQQLQDYLEDLQKVGINHGLE